MSYNGSGSFSLSDTIANGTPNDADELQAILDDIATGLSNAVCVDGQSTMTGVLKNSNGSAAAPSITFGSDTNSGFYRKAADDIGVSVNGSLLANFDSNGLTLASGAFVGSLTGAWSGIPTGTKMLFQQTSAPTGWTKDTTHNNKALRVVSGTASSGGSVDFTTAFASQAVSGTVGNTTLTIDQIPAHTHSLYKNTTIGAGAGSAFNPIVAGSGTAEVTGSSGTGGSHTHTFTGTAINLAVAYVDLIICTKS